MSGSAHACGDWNKCRQEGRAASCLADISATACEIDEHYSPTGIDSSHVRLLRNLPNPPEGLR